MAQSTPTTNFGFQDFFSTTLSSGITASDTTIPLAAAPTPTEGILVIEPDSSTNREIIMYTSVSGSNVVCGSTDDRGISGTTARAHSAGVVVKMNTAADMFEALQSGNALADGAIKPRKLVSGSGTSWVWQTWTPTLSGQFTDGDWTKSCKYIQIGKTVIGRFSIVATDATPMGGGAGAGTFTLPVTSVSYPSATYSTIGHATINDNGTALIETSIKWSSTTTARFEVMVATGGAGTYIRNDTAFSSTAPMTWTTNDAIDGFVIYEAA